MQAKDLTQDDVGKWVMLRARIISMADGGPYARLEGDTNEYMRHEVTFPANAIVEFCAPYSPVENADYLIGDVFKNIGTHPAEWSIAAIQGNACIMRYLTGHVSADYPLNPALWEFVRKGNAA